MEKSFSQRMGFKPIRSTFQIDSMDDILRNKLWNGLQRYYWDVIGHKLYINHYSGGSEYPLSKDEEIKQFYEILWDRYFKKTLDTLKSDWSENHPFVREYFFSYAWYEVYDFIEFITDYYPEKNRNLSFIKYCNLILEQEMSAYRFVGNKISPIIENEEIKEIEKALETPFEPVRKHLKIALEMLSDRKNTDYRNSIKESISAVEALCRIISGKDKATLGDALNIIEKKKPDFLHPALKGAFEKIYGYTSDEGGIRHAMSEMKQLRQEDARFMLIACSAFVNYLIDKTKGGQVQFYV